MASVELFDQRLTGYIIVHISQSLILNESALGVFDAQDFAFFQATLSSENRQQPYVFHAGGNIIMQLLRACALAHIGNQDNHRIDTMPGPSIVLYAFPRRYCQSESNQPDFYSGRFLSL